MTTARRILRAMCGQAIGRSYARQRLGITDRAYSRAIASLRNRGLIELAGLRGTAWEWRLTETGKEQAK